MKNVDDLIAWKTNAWKDPNMVSWYSLRMVENSGQNKLNNRLETSIIAEHLGGNNIIDIGIGTGRASLPLLKAGNIQLTGIDSSQAMLDECQRLAGDLPITLTPGDVTNVPFPDESFDSAIALNVLTHFPHWQTVVRHWANKVKAGGRIIFDVYSLDHLRLVKGERITEQALMPKNDQEIASFNLRVAVEDILSFANQEQLTVKALVPYRGLLGNSDINLLLEPYLDGRRRWNRMLSWMSCDDHLLNLAYFIERTVFYALGTGFSNKIMVVLENSVSEDANQSWIDLERFRSSLWQKNILSASDFELLLPLPINKVRKELKNYSWGIRNQHFLYSLIKPLLFKNNFDLSSIFTTNMVQQFNCWFMEDLQDYMVMDTVYKTSQEINQERDLDLDGVPVGEVFEYNLAQNIFKNMLKDNG